LLLAVRNVALADCVCDAVALSENDDLALNLAA
jgi:hypothetical protein